MSNVFLSNPAEKKTECIIDIKRSRIMLSRYIHVPLLFVFFLFNTFDVPNYSYK